jgi:3-oxoacyl-[acyl-carrier protein] reductase
LKRTVIITGGTKGLGREMSLAFARAGYCVLALYSSDEAAAGKLTADLAEIKATGFAVRYDVRSDDPSIWNRTEIQTADDLTLVHNACAAFTPVPMHQLAWSDFERNLLVAVKGAWLCSQSLIRAMLKNKRGAIVTILTAALEGAPPKGFAAYAVAKHALRGFTLALAAEYAARGLRVFSVSPGFMETSLTAQWDPRLRAAIRTHSTRITLPPRAASQIVALVESAAVPGRGEDYPV